jgi:hypothetical protein
VNKNRVQDYEQRPGPDQLLVLVSNRTTYKLEVDVLLTPQATGKYVLYAVADKNVATSYFIFAEAKSKPFLIGASSTRSHMLKPKRITSGKETILILPCVTSNYNVTVNLYQRIKIIQVRRDQESLKLVFQVFLKYFSSFQGFRISAI